eukprot:TRINITY_DN13136_c0_g3_i1.p1 TRINITY_DN13136_c0_g3~~TRINITY_DN13136_c0_g3_i1.p1  ORF type:complete len:443 (-),score=111.24 TRINITY_DN13136_c0_g3_i1:202-1530(-)
MAMQRNPTFVVGQVQQRENLAQLQRREQHLNEEYRRNKPLCFSARGYQKTHPTKVLQGRTDADATLVSPMLLGVADGVSQIEDFGIDPAELPHELLSACQELALDQLMPAASEGRIKGDEPYLGPIPMMRKAFEATESLGSTTILLSILDNSSRIHGKLHPMIAVLAIGDCEMLILRRCAGWQLPLEMVFHTEMQRIGGNSQAPLQVARVDDRVDPNFDESITIDVIERGSAVHCMSAYEGDIVIQGSDGVFDNLFLDEIVAIANEYLPPRSGRFQPEQPEVLESIARRIVAECHKKTEQSADGRLHEAPIGKGGKIDDTCCVVGQVIEWTDQHNEVWGRIQRQRNPRRNFASCGADHNTVLDTTSRLLESLGLFKCGAFGNSSEYEGSEYGSDYAPSEFNGSEYDHDENQNPGDFFNCKAVQKMHGDPAAVKGGPSRPRRA